LEYGYALKEGLATAQLMSARGEFVRAGPESFKLALASQRPARASHYQVLTRSGNMGAWPLVATEYGLIEQQGPRHEAAARLLGYFARSRMLADFQFLPYGAGASGEHVN
jgi:hypothetical protein